MATAVDKKLPGERMMVGGGIGMFVGLGLATAVPYISGMIGEPLAILSAMVCYFGSGAMLFAGIGKMFKSEPAARKI